MNFCATRKNSFKTFSFFTFHFLFCMSRFSLMVIFVIVGLLLTGFVIIPGVRNVFVLLDRQSVLKEANAALQDIMTSRDRLQAEYRAIPEEQLLKLNALLPEEPEIGNLLTVYESVAKRNGLSLVSIDFSGGAQARSGGAQAARQKDVLGKNQKIVKTVVSGAIPLPVTQSLQGSYDAFRNYLGDLEFLLNLTDITDISFSPADLQNANFSIQGTTYYFAK